MAVVIGEIITETVLRPAEPQPTGGGGATQDTDLDLVVRRAVERVLEVLRREWDR